MNTARTSRFPGETREKRYLALPLTFCMVLGLMPAMTLPASADGSVTDFVIPAPVEGIYTRTTPLVLTSASVTYYKAGDTVGNPTGSASPSSQSITDTAEGWSWAYSNSYPKLTLNGLNLQVELGSKNYAALNLPYQTEVILTGDNYIKVSRTEANTSYPAYAVQFNRGANKVGGSGSLNILLGSNMGTRDGSSSSAGFNFGDNVADSSLSFKTF